MKKVYVVQVGADYEGEEIVGIYTDMTLAIEHFDKLKEGDFKQIIIMTLDKAYDWCTAHPVLKSLSETDY